MRRILATLPLLALVLLALVGATPARAASGPGVASSTLPSIAAQSGNQQNREGGPTDVSGLVAFFDTLFTGLQLVGVAIGVLMAGWAGIKIATGQRDGMEKLVYAGIGVFVLLMAKPIMTLIQSATGS